MRTLEVIEIDLQHAKDELEPIAKAYNEACEKISKFKDEMERYKVKNGMYHPMEELKSHIGKEISSIKLVEKSKSGKLEVNTMHNHEMFSVDRNGHLCFSSYEMGVMGWDGIRQKYGYSFHYHTTYHDFVGYFDLDFEEDDEREE